MSEKENLAFEYLKKQQWSQACQTFDQIIGSNFNCKLPRDRMVLCLLGRTECCLEIGRYDTVVQDCRRLLKFVHEVDVLNAGACVRRRLVHSLFKLKRYNEAELVCREWLNSCYSPQSNPEFIKTLERIRAVLQMANGQKSNQRVSQQKLDEEMVLLDVKLDNWILTGICSDITKQNSQTSGIKIDTNSKKPVHIEISKPPHEMLTINVNNFQKQIDQVGLQNITASEVPPFSIHNFNENSKSHGDLLSADNHFFSDEGREWKWRPPPRGFTAETYALCDTWQTSNSCHFGAQCVEAHGLEELTEWKERFEYRKIQMQKACETEHSGKSYTEQLLERWIQSSSPDKVIKEKVDGVEETCSADLVTTVSSKVSKRDWTFVLKTKKTLKAVALLQDVHRNHFVLKQVFPGELKPNKKGRDSHKVVEAELTSDQEWTSSPAERYDPTESSPTLEHRVKVVFSTDIYGTFRQSVVFDFGSEPVLVKHLCVDVVPVSDADKIKEIKKEMAMSTAERWDLTNADIVPFLSPVYPGLATPYSPGDGEKERSLLAMYPAPRADTFTLTQGTVVERGISRDNYRARMHELLYVEELARIERVARYNVTCKFMVAESYLLAPSGMSASTAKYAHAGELFAVLTLGKDISEDTSAGRLILNNCTTVLVGEPSPPEIGKRKVYESLIEDKVKNMVYLRLPAIAVSSLGLRPSMEYNSEVQFQLNRLTYCEWHYAVDKITDLRLIFPDVAPEPSIPWSPQRQWSETLDTRLNSKQKEAVVAITTPAGMPLPPILLIGPFGTGKTYTLAQAIKQLLMQSEPKILICTHSNSAADLYIKDYLHPWLEAGLQEAKPLRVYYHKRWVATVNQTVQKYCLIESNGAVRNFRLPTLEDVLKHRIVVVTLSISMYLATLGLPKGYFTHILLDEAAQAMESEALMPLALADANSRVVLAGDHMQLSPELFSQFACERNLHVSLLERLYDHYPPSFPCKILLCENYRAHDAIVNFTSELFYEQKLVASGRQPRHEKFFPLTFFTTRGEDVQDHNSTAFYNNSEVYEVVERVHELRRRWPQAWGRFDEHSIGIMTPYADQVFRIRSELRKKKMGSISVERVLNVQGKQFRAVFLSTVRTRRTCSTQSATTPSADADYGFLSNRKLLNTAITRAQSLVAVVGDPVALCSVGKCRKLWERFIRICHDNQSLFGVTWGLLRQQLDGLEFKKTYSLNPLAPEFVPRSLQTEAYIKMRPEPPQPNVVTPNANMTATAALTFPSLPYAAAPIYFASMQQPAFARIPPPTAPPPAAPPPYPALPMQQIPPWSNFTQPTPAIAPITANWQNKQMQKRPDIVYHAGAALTPRSNPLTQNYATPRLSPESPSILQFPLADSASPYPRQQNLILSNPPRFPDRPQQRQEKEQIQFLQNVHFPERLQQQTLGNLSGLTNSAFATTNHIGQNVPNAGTGMQVTGNSRLVHNSNTGPPRDDAQLLWYRHLLETQGADSATRFLELISQQAQLPQQVQPPSMQTQPPFSVHQQSRQTQQLPQQQPMKRETFPQLDDINIGLGEIFVDKNVYRGPAASFGPVNGHRSTPTAQRQTEQRPWTEDAQRDSLANFINNKVFQRDLESSPAISAFNVNSNAAERDERLLLQHQLQQQQQQHQQQHRRTVSSYLQNEPPPIELPWQSSKPASQSVPLYRRQAGVAQVGEQTQSDKQAATGAFAGYARAFSLQQGDALSSVADEQQQWGELLRTYASVLRDEPCGSQPASVHSSQQGLYQYFN